MTKAEDDSECVSAGSGRKHQCQGKQRELQIFLHGSCPFGQLFNFKPALRLPHVFKNTQIHVPLKIFRMAILCSQLRPRRLPMD